MTILPAGGVDWERRKSALVRRGRIVEVLSRELEAKEPSSAAGKLQTLLDAEPRPLVVSGDIDGLVSASMLARVSDWKASVLVIKSDYVLVHPAVVGALDLSTCFGVDIFNSYMPNVSNHTVFYGRKRPSANAEAGAAAKAYDEVLRARGDSFLFANPSFWAGIEGATSGSKRPWAHDYRYPLGTAQLLLALLEAIGRSPRLFDREYLPWLIANCDGGLDTIRTYAFNVPMWWSCLAAAVGPATLSESIYQLASTQRPNQFLSVVHQLRSEGNGVPGWVSDYLDDKWNIKNPGAESIASVVQWLATISGWPDPFRGGAKGLDSWIRFDLKNRGSLSIVGLPRPRAKLPRRVREFKKELRSSLEAFHTGFSYYEERSLNWEKPWAGASAPKLPPLPPALK